MKKRLNLAKAYLWVCLLPLVISCGKKENNYQKIEQEHVGVHNLFIENLTKTIANLDSIIGQPIEKQKEFYSSARHYFKRSEPLLAYFDKANYKSLNAPNIFIVRDEESFDTKKLTPFGFQAIEETLYEDVVDTLALKQLVSLTGNRLKLIKKNAAPKIKDYHIIWLIRQQLVRIATTGITGFDSPVLGQSLKESSDSYQSIIDILKLNASRFTSKEILHKFIELVETSQMVLNHDFNSFDRYSFIKNNIQPQLEVLVEIQKDWKVKFPFEMALSNTLTHLFSKDALNEAYFSDHKNDTTQLEAKVMLGRQLFNDKSLSKAKDMACATCHVKALAFTDGKRVFDKRQTRNTPTVAYASYQKAFFMDLRAGSLEGQVIGVVNNHNEFNMTMDSVVARVKNKTSYRNQLNALYANKRLDYNIRHAIASYIRSLNTFDSKFDKNIRGEDNTLTQEEINGFNLFMGKALCATCHFAPVFNGTVPPVFSDTEMEAIGVPNLEKTALSNDLGRYDLFKTEERKHFFKTPSIRNIEKTAPYMHNGTYNTLEEVMDFYNKGGGNGLGFHNDYQTLPFDNLNLSEQEVSEIIAFMKTLTDAI